MNQEIKKVIPKLEGRILMIGFDPDKLSELINKNNNITYCDFLNLFGNSKGNGYGGKIVNIRKLRKKYKKKKLDYIFVNMDEVNKYIKYFVKDSIYICKQKIYIFNNTNPDLNKLYKRYNVQITTNKFKTDILLEVDTTKAKNKIILDNIYFIGDTLIDLLNKISDFLLS